MSEKDATRSVFPPPGRSTKLHPYRSVSQEADVLVPRPSILLPMLQDTEKKFFELVSTGKPPKFRQSYNTTLFLF